MTRIDAIMSDLMNDLYVAMDPANIDAILNPPAPALEAQDEAPAYSIPFPTASGGRKTYDATRLSSSRRRNLELLLVATQDLAMAAQVGADTDAIKEMMRALIDAL